MAPDRSTDTPGSTDATELVLPPSPRRRGLAGWLLALWRRLRALVAGFRGEPIGLRAGNLTFVTVTSLVPLAVVILSLVHQFGAAHLDRLVQGLFTELLSPGGEQTVRAFFSATHVRAAGSVSFLVVMASAGVLLRHLDASLNEVWAVRRRRSLLASLGLYAGTLVFGPLLIVLSLLGTEGLKHVVAWLELPLPGSVFELGTVLWAAAVFSLLYKYAPHASVPWKSALIGGVAAGLCWEVARKVYGGMASLFLSADALYGSLGIAPLFLAWVYVAWYIVLAGARLGYAVAHVDFHDQFGALLAHPRSQELIASRIAELLTRALQDGLGGRTVSSLASELRLPQQRVAEVCACLVDAGLVARSPGQLLFPARPPEELTLADISRAVGGTDLERNPGTGPFQVAARLFTVADEVTLEKLGELTWVDLARAYQDAELSYPRKP